MLQSIPAARGPAAAADSDSGTTVDVVDPDLGGVSEEDGMIAGA